jgi:hypothetical protein
MRKLTTMAAVTGVAAMLLPGATAAQPVPGAEAGTCLERLSTLDRRMEQDGFWLVGYRANLGWTGVSTPPGTEPNVGTRAPGLPRLGSAPARDAGSESRTGHSPFVGMDWQTAPAEALRTLFAAAQILGQSSREEPCRVVLAAAEQDYEGFVAQLRRAGVEPARSRA